MKKTINRILLIFLIMTLAIVGTSPPLYADTTTPGTPPKLPPNILKLRDVKIGMEGEGKTIFKGTKIETFKFKVLGILEKYQPGKDMIIVELSESDVLAEAGIIAGMSGSPVYVDGKLMGAVAFGFNYSKKPIGGVTPIEDMINIDEHNRPTVSIDISDIRIDFSEKNLKSISNRLRQELAKLATFSPSKAFSPIKLIGHQKGMDPTSLSLLSPMFTPLNSLKIKSQPGNKLKINEDLFKISPADAASVVLVKGDFEYSASGTVTYVDGNKVYLFGHPYFNLGTVDFPMHKADVISVIPSYRESFKLVSTRSMIGSVIQDRSTAVQAELGRSPYMIPMKVFLQNRNKSFNVEIINHPLLTPALASISLESVFSSEYKDFGFQAIRVNGKIFIENEKNIIIDDLYSGSTAAGELSNMLLAINFFLLNNPDKTVKIQKIDFDINCSERISRTRIENVITAKRAYYPGELIDVAIYLKNERGNTPQEKVQVKAPNLKPGSTFYLLVADRSEIINFDNRNIKAAYFPTKLNTLIRAINNLRKNNRIYIKIMTPSQGVYIKGHEYAHLPSTMQNLFIYNTKSAAQSKIKYSTLSEYQIPIPAVVTGHKLFKLKIKERSDIDAE